jgi:hypothetical protein
LAKKKQKQVAKEKKEQKESNDIRYNELQKKRQENSPIKSSRPRGNRGGKKKKKTNPTQKNLLDEFQAAGVACVTVADEDRGPTDSHSGSEGDDKEPSLGKGKLKNDEDYNSDTNVKKGDDDNATESKDEAKIKGDEDADGGEEQEEETPTSPSNQKKNQEQQDKKSSI